MLKSGGGGGVASERLKEATFAVEGMSCSACVSTIERALRRVDGVVRAHVSLLVEKAEVTYRAGSSDDDDDDDGAGAASAGAGVGDECDDATIVEAIEAVGFGATHLHTRELGGGSALVEESRFVLALTRQGAREAVAVEAKAIELLSAVDGVVRVKTSTHIHGHYASSGSGSGGGSAGNAAALAVAETAGEIRVCATHLRLGAKGADGHGELRPNHHDGVPRRGHHVAIRALRAAAVLHAWLKGLLRVVRALRA